MAIGQYVCQDSCLLMYPGAHRGHSVSYLVLPKHQPKSPEAEAFRKCVPCLESVTASLSH